MRFIHTSDIHLGAKFLNLKHKAKEQQNEIKNTFTKIVDFAIDQKIDLFLVSGDIFDNPFPSDINKEFFRNQMYRLSDNNIKCYIIPGNHDNIQTGAVWDTDIFSDPNIFLLRHTDPIDFNGFKFQLLHGSVDFAGRKGEYSIQYLNSLNVNYIALGDWHSFLEIIPNLAYYSGSPEFIDISQTGAGKIILGNYENNKLNIESIQISNKKFLSIELDVTDSINFFTLLKVLPSANPNLILDLKLTGVFRFQLNEEELINELLRMYFFVKITNNTLFQIDLNNLLLTPGTVEFEFANILNQKLRANPEDKVIADALNYGLGLLSQQ